jgi:CubicO group peptidase (beta-lactamase class C family)
MAMKRLLLAVLLLLAGFEAATAQPAPGPELRAATTGIEAMAAVEFASDPVGGLTLGLVVGRELVFTKSWGHADSEARRAASSDTVYRIGSITKQFTSLMLLQLADQGKLRLTDPVEKHLPEIAKVPRLFEEQGPVTLLELATMTSGLSREPEGPPDHSQGPVSGWEGKVMASIPLTTYAHEPRTRYLYSNIGYAVLGAALSRAAGAPFVEYVEKRILAPLGMSLTVFDPDERHRPHLARGYTVSAGRAEWTAADREWSGRGYRVPNGGLLSTVGDLARFLSWEVGEGPPGILKKQTQDDNYSRVYSANGSLSSGYGLGFQATRRGELVALGHGGSTAGFRAQAYVHRPTKTGVIVLRNVAGGKLDPGDLALKALEKLAASRPKAATED